MRLNRAPWVRFVEGFASAESSVVSGGSSAPADGSVSAGAPGAREQKAAPEEVVAEDPEPEPEPEAEPESDSESVSEPSSVDDSSSSDDEGEDSGGRGSKRAVLADLAGERKARQAAEKQLASLTSEVESLTARVAEFERRELLASVVAETGLPSSLADRLQGSSREELLADAKKLVADVGFDSAPVDPSSGASGSTQPLATSLEDSLATHYSNL